MRLKFTQMDLKIQENWLILEGPGGHFWSSEASWVRFALPKGLGAVSGAVLDGSWALLGAVLACPGRQLEPSWLPREHQERTKMILKIERLLDTLWHLLFRVFSWILGANMGACWHPRGRKIRG